MAPRKNTQSNHNRTVRRVAGGFKSQGWKVNADVPGYSAPRTIYGRQPDVIATKGKKIRVVEIETPSSYVKDTLQRKAFKGWTSQSNKRRFRTKITK